MGLFSRKTAAEPADAQPSTNVTPQAQSSAVSEKSSIDERSDNRSRSSGCQPFFAHGPRESWRRKHKSSRLDLTVPYEKPWAAKKDPKEKWERIIFFGGIAIAFGVGAVLCWHSWTSVTNFDVSRNVYHNLSFH